jgi:hypothetical protein
MLSEGRPQFLNDWFKLHDVFRVDEFRAKLANLIFESARARYESFTRDDRRIVYRKNCICRMAYGAATTSS